MFVLLLLLALLVGVRAMTAGESLESPVQGRVLAAARQQGMTGAALAGALVFAKSGCTSCHTYAGIGSPNLGAPDLTGEGRKAKGVRFQVAHLRCPSCAVPGSAMPSFAALDPASLRKLAVFLEASKGGA